MNTRFHTIALLAITTSAFIYIKFWCPWMKVTPSSFVFIAYALIALAAILDSDVKGPIWIYWAAVWVCFLRMIIFWSRPDTLQYWRSYEFAVWYVEPVLVVLIGLLCFAIALTRRLART